MASALSKQRFRVTRAESDNVVEARSVASLSARETRRYCGFWKDVNAKERGDWGLRSSGALEGDSNNDIETNDMLSAVCDK